MSPLQTSATNGHVSSCALDEGKRLEQFAPCSDLDRINHLLRDFLRRADRRFASDVRLKRLFHHLTAFALQGGKRIRPRLCLASHRILARRETTPPEVWSCSAVLELLHAFMLAHDDLIDGSVKRRDQDALHERIRLDEELGGKVKTASDLGLVGGDLLFALGVRLLSASGLSGPALTRSLRLFSSMLIETGLGEALDVLHDDCPLESINESQISDAYLRKTARYSISGPLVLGATLARAPAETRRSLNRFGDLLGFGYQVRNDLEALARDPETGDHPDLDAGKRTWVLWRTFRNLPDSGRQDLRQTLRLPAGLAKRQRLLALIRESGAIEDGRALLKQSRDDAVEALERSPLDSDQRRGFLVLPRLFSNDPSTS